MNNVNSLAACILHEPVCLNLYDTSHFTGPVAKASRHNTPHEANSHFP